MSRPGGQSSTSSIEFHGRDGTQLRRFRPRVPSTTPWGWMELWNRGVKNEPSSSTSSIEFHGPHGTVRAYVLRLLREVPK